MPDGTTTIPGTVHRELGSLDTRVSALEKARIQDRLEINSALQQIANSNDRQEIKLDTNKKELEVKMETNKKEFEMKLENSLKPLTDSIKTLLEIVAKASGFIKAVTVGATIIASTAGIIIGILKYLH